MDCSDGEPVVVRLGGVAPERLAALLGRPLPVHDDGRRAAPGTRPSHYAPHAHVVLADADDVARLTGELLATGRRVGLLAAAPPSGVPADVVWVPAPDDVEDLARQLYGLLRSADDRGLDVLVAIPPDPTGVGAAVVDRLTRAAAVTPARVR